MSEIKYFTPEGLQKLKDELDELILRERPRIVQAIQEARDKGDLSENAEYDAAKEAQGLLEAKIAELQDLIFNARILDESKMDNSKVLLYSTVTNGFWQNWFLGANVTWNAFYGEGEPTLVAPFHKFPSGSYYTSHQQEQRDGDRTAV